MAKLHIQRNSGGVVIGKTTYNIPEGVTNKEVEAAILRYKKDRAIKDRAYIVGRSLP
jgi:hypothetical protein